MTFRLDENVITTLRAESERRHISLNTIVNQILQRYIEWDMYESKVGLISMLRPVVTELFKKTNKQEIIDLATSIGKNATNDAALFMKNKMDVDSFLSWLDVRMKNSSVEISHSIEGSTHTYILKHDLGENYSLFQKTVLELIFSDVLRKHIDCSFSDTILSFRFSSWVSAASNPVRSGKNISIKFYKLYDPTAKPIISSYKYVKNYYNCLEQISIF
jgi:hypothetical protein